jgi:hypothetical protein
VENLASRLILEKCTQKSNGLTYQKNKNIGSRFSVEESPCKISALKLFPVAGSHGLASGISTGDDFDLRKTCTKFHPKILTLIVSNPGAKNPPKSHFWTWLIYLSNSDNLFF